MHFLRANSFAPSFLAALLGLAFPFAGSSPELYFTSTSSQNPIQWSILRIEPRGASYDHAARGLLASLTATSKN